jgi:hypothetical protein
MLEIAKIVLMQYGWMVLGSAGLGALMAMLVMKTVLDGRSAHDAELDALPHHEPSIPLNPKTGSAMVDECNDGMGNSWMD